MRKVHFSQDEARKYAPNIDFCRVIDCPREHIVILSEKEFNTLAGLLDLNGGTK